MRGSIARRAHGAILLSLLLAGGPALAQEAVPVEAGAAAKKGLEVFRRLLTEKTSGELGFATPAQADKAGLGMPFREYLVGLNDLAAWTTAGDAAKLLRGGDEYTFPVLVGEDVRSSISVARIDAAWKPVSFGSPGRARTISEVRAASARDGKAAASFSLVVVPALYVQFLGRLEGGRLLLTPLRDDQSVEFKKGAELPAEVVFGKLAPLARKLQQGPVR
jgi:hypothetical protein